MQRTILPALLAISSALLACTDGAVTANNVAPEAYIQVPTEGTEMFEDETVTFCGVATDHEDAVDVLSMSLATDLDGLLWSSTHDPEPVGDCEAGEGIELELAGLSIGEHVLTFRVVDTRGADGEDTVTLTVMERPNDPPSCAITSPLDGDVVLEGEGVLFAGEVSDPDQDPDTLEVTWESDEDGVLDQAPADASGAVGFDTSTLSVGDHLVSLIVEDDLGEIDVCFVLVGIDPCEDVDGDGVENCDGDCDDTDADTYPGADELPDLEDNDCDGTVDEETVFYDDDGDGYCEGPLSCSDGSQPGDCDDGNDAVYPGAPEDGGSGTGMGNGVDDDCDGLVDEGTLEYDDDGDGYSELAGDCDDADPGAHPGAVELCDGADNDCNGIPDDRDLDLDGQVAADCGGTDCDDLDPYSYLGATEICGNGADEDCNGTPDDLDEDGDGYISSFCGGNDCNDATATAHPGATEVCDGIDNDCDGFGDDEDGDGFLTASCGGPDCDDGDPLVNPAEMEQCGNGLDDDCNGVVDDLDEDGDGFDDIACDGADCDDSDPAVNPAAPEVCGNGIDDDCSGLGEDADEDLDGYVDEACSGTDCDDANPFIHPDALEVCDGVDDDCDGVVDDRDLDGDGHVDEACSGDDCDDLDPFTYDGAVEIPDLADNDCDGDVDEGTVLVDDDGDGLAEVDGDCDDGDAGIFPGATEICNGVDDDCNGAVDDRDVDGDLFVDEACGGADCDDGDGAISPIAPEICGNGTDDDCSGLADDADEDFDGFVDDACGGDDCDDADPFVHPAAQEACNGADDDCNGAVDDRDVDGDGSIDDACGGDDCDDLDALTYPGAPEVYDLRANDCVGAGIVDAGMIPEGAVVVSEFMSDPDAVVDLVGEWFEVANAWHLPINLDTWTIRDDDGQSVDLSVPGGLVIGPGEVAVFCADDDPALNGGVGCDVQYSYANFGLTNGGDEIVLELAGDLIDELVYDGDFPLGTGASTALDPITTFADLNDVTGNWCLAESPFGDGDLGTPGDVNPPCSGLPEVDAVEPDQAVMSGGEEVEISGSGFVATTAVTVGGNPCDPWEVLDDETIACTVPPGSVGYADVVVTKGEDESAPDTQFLYTGQSVTELSWCNVQWPAPAELDLSPGDTAEVWGRFHAYDVGGASLTDPDGSLADSDPDYFGELGFGPLGSDPRMDPGWRWSSAAFNADDFENEEYVGTLTAPAVGSYQYAYRFTDDGGFNFLYCDAGDYEQQQGGTPGTADGFQVDDLGILDVH